MKKNLWPAIATSLLLTALFQNAMAQNTAPYWSLNGNNNASLSNKIGTTNAVSLRFVTNNTERMKILSTGNVGIGTSNPSSKLHVVGSSVNTTALKVSNGRITVDLPWNTGDTHYGIYSAAGTGVHGEGMVGIEGEGMVGVHGSGYTGVSGYSDDGSGGSGVEGYSSDGDGVYGNSTNSYGGNFESLNSAGIRASTTNAFYAAEFYGNVFATGTYYSSDKALKQNIREVGDAMNLINKLKPRYYDFKTEEKYKFLHLPKGSHYGLLAQDVEAVLPNLVSTTDHQVLKPGNYQTPQKPGAPATMPPLQKEASERISLKAVNYTELIPIIIKGMQEQSALNEKQNGLIAQQQQQIELLKQEINLLKGNRDNSLVKTGMLSQATPNPVRSSTRISYSLPGSAGRGQLLLIDAAGKTVKAVSLNGSGNVNLNTMGLASGIYSYSLFVDGKIVATKMLEIVRSN